MPSILRQFAKKSRVGCVEDADTVVLFQPHFEARFAGYARRVGRKLSRSRRILLVGPEPRALEGRSG